MLTDDAIKKAAHAAELAYETNWHGESIVACRWIEDVDLMPYLRRFADAIEAATLASSSAAREDAERLDWLDRMNAALNMRYGTVYGWKLVLSPNVVRLMAESPFRSEMASIDLHDSAGRGVRSCREAIDAAMKDAARSATKGEGAG